MDVVICVALKDCLFLRKNLFFIKKNLNPENIYIISKKRNFKLLPKDSNIIFIEEDKLLEGLSFTRVKSIIDKYLSNHLYGWYFQQFLKLAFALSKYAKDEYLVWDADTVPLVPLSFHNDNGQTLILPKKEYHKPYHDTIKRLFPITRTAPFSFISEHMMFDVQIVQEMLRKIELSSKEGYIWFEQCVAARNEDVLQVFSEFETYGTYCLNYHPDKLCPRHLKTFRFGSKIFGIIASMKEIESLSFDLDTVSFEIRDLPISWHRRIIQWLLYMGCRIIIKLGI